MRRTPQLAQLAIGCKAIEAVMLAELLHVRAEDMRMSLPALQKLADRHSAMLQGGVRCVTELLSEPALLQVVLSWRARSQVAACAVRHGIGLNLQYPGEKHSRTVYA